MLSEINLFLNFSAKLFVESKSIIVGPSSILAKRKDSIAWSYIYYEWIAAVSASASFIAKHILEEIVQFSKHIQGWSSATGYRLQKVAWNYAWYYLWLIDHFLNQIVHKSYQYRKFKLYFEINLGRFISMKHSLLKSFMFFTFQVIKQLFFKVSLC